MTVSPDYFLLRPLFQALAVGALLAAMALMTFAAGLALLGALTALPVLGGLVMVPQFLQGGPRACGGAGCPVAPTATLSE